PGRSERGVPVGTRASEDEGQRRFAAGRGLLRWEESPRSTTSGAAPRWAAATALCVDAILALGAVALGHHLAFVDPALDADPAGGRAGLEEAVVDVGAQGVQRHPSVRVALRARHLGATEAAGDLDADALRPGAHRRGQGPLHRAAEGDPVLELLGDRLSDQLRVQLGALDLADVHLHGLAGELVQVAAQGVHLAARLADHDARPGGVDVDSDLAAALDCDVGEPRVGELALDVLADRNVLEQLVGEPAVVEPGRLPVVDVADPEALGMDLLAHQSSTSGLSATEIWLVRLLILVARPSARGR